MRILTGDDNGLVKCSRIHPTEAPKQVFKYGLQKENYEVHNLRWSLPPSSAFCTFTHSNGVVKTFDLQKEKVFIKRELTLDDKCQIRSIALIGDDIMSQTLLYAQSNGSIFTTKLDYEDEDQKREEIVQVKKRSDDKKLTAMEHRNGSQYLFLGQFLPQIYDIETKKLVWKGKNVSNDEDDLEIPLFDTSGQFLPNSTREFVISNGYGKLRLYDVLRKPKPMIDVQAWDYPVTKVKMTDCGNYAIYSTQKGELTKTDLRMNFRMVHKFKGAKGTIRDIGVWGDFVAWIGLDRYLRVYHHETKETVGTLYMKQKLNTILIDPNTVQDFADGLEEKHKKEQEQEEREFHEFWNQGSNPRKRRRRQDEKPSDKGKLFKMME